MYLPHAFVEADPERAFALVERHDFATLVAITPEGAAEIAHLPVLLDRDGARLLVHAARANPIGQLALAGAPLTVVFQGPHGYVSAGWYEEPARQVPTWNYAVVHVHGRAVGPMASDELLEMLTRLSRRHEATSPSPWRVEAMDEATRSSLLQAIVGFAIPIERIEAKFKLSQNRSAEDRARVVRALNERGGPDDVAMTKLMSNIAE